MLRCLLIVVLASCRSHSESTLHETLNPRVASNINEAQTSYLDANSEGWRWFSTEPVGQSGVPLALLRLFPKVFPDIWPENWPDAVGFPAGFEDGVDGLPYGLGRTQQQTQLTAGPNVTVVNFTCGACHTGGVRDKAGNPQVLIGAPNTRIDLSLWRSKLYRTVKDPRYTLSNFRGAMPSPASMQQHNAADTSTDFAPLVDGRGEALLANFKASTERTYESIHAFVAQFGYTAETRRLLDQGAVGQLEGGFGALLSKIVPSEWSKLDPSKRRAKLQEYFMPSRVTVDIPSLWRQEQRPVSQWDGAVTARILRNLGAELGIVPESDKVSFANARIVARFAAKLPPPRWPFALDATKVEAGRKIFAGACAGCHGQASRVIPLSVIGTDPARVPGLTPLARLHLSRMILAACRDPNEGECQTPEQEVIRDMGESRGYVAAPLDGIWARAPYLHNGSVPTLEQMLVPRLRAKTFWRGSLAYDMAQVGYAWQTDSGGRHLYDTQHAGNSNQGHSDRQRFFSGIDFEQDQVGRLALLEYLKTL